MKNTAIVMGIVGLMAMAAFAGVANAAPVVDSPSDSGDHTAFGFYQTVDGIQICSGPMHDSFMAIPYGNVTLYETGEVPFDWAKTPEEQGGYVADGTNGHASDAGYYVFCNFGGDMADWFPAVVFNAVAEIGPSAWGGHHPTATKNYTASTHDDGWDGEPESWPDSTIRAVPTLVGTNNAGNMVLTWTDTIDDNNVITGYRIYKRTGAGAWTRITTVGEGVQTYTDAGGYLPTNRYAIGLRFNDNFFTWGKSNIVRGTANIPPISVAGGDQSVTTGTLVTFDGSGSSDPDGSIAAYSWTFTDVTPQTLVGVGPTYTFNNVGVYTVTLQVTDNLGATDATPDTMTVTVTSTVDIIRPVANAGPDQTVNEDTLVTFDGSASTDNIGVTSWTWTFTDGVPRTLTGVGPVYTFATPGVYTVTLNVADLAGNTDLTPDTMTVTVNDNSPIQVTDNTPGTIEPGTAFDIECVGTDFQTLAIGDIVLYWEDVTGTQLGPIAASTFTSVVDNQLTKADDGNELKDTHTWTWAIPAQATPGEVHYWFATDDGAGHTATEPVGATFLANYATVLVQIAGNQNQPHPLLGYVLDPLGAGLVGALVEATWYDANDGAYFTMTAISATDGLGNLGWFQIDIYHNNWTAGDPMWVNATFNIAGVDYYGYNFTVFAAGDNILPDDDKEYVNVTIVVQEYFELKWTLGWNIWSHPMIRSENVSLGLTDLPFSWFANQHWLDTSQVGVGDDATLVAWNGAAYITYVYPLDNGTGNDITVTPDNGYWAFVGESWFTDEAALAIPEVGVLVPGQYVWRHALIRNIAVAAGWNLLGWTSFNTTFVATDVIMTLTTGAVSGDGVPQPELIANWTSDDWELGNTADMQHWEGAKGYTTFAWLGVYGQSLPAYDFPVGPGYGFWVYSEVGGQTLTYVTA